MQGCRVVALSSPSMRLVPGGGPGEGSTCKGGRPSVLHAGGVHCPCIAHLPPPPHPPPPSAPDQLLDLEDGPLDPGLGVCVVVLWGVGDAGHNGEGGVGAAGRPPICSQAHPDPHARTHAPQLRAQLGLGACRKAVGQQRAGGRCCFLEASWQGHCPPRPPCCALPSHPLHPMPSPSLPLRTPPPATPSCTGLAHRPHPTPTPTQPYYPHPTHRQPAGARQHTYRQRTWMPSMSLQRHQ